MTKSSEQVERRKHTRVSVEGRADAVLFGKDFTKGVQILDISPGGLSFRYVNGQAPLDGPLEIDIIWDHANVFLLNLQVETTSDVEVANEFLLGVIPIRRCGGVFCNLTTKQIDQLTTFVDNNGPA